MMQKGTASIPGRRAGGSKARLAVYRRYAAIVREQFRALEDEDLTRFEALADDRQKIQDEMGQDAPGIPAPGQSESDGTVMVDGIRNELEEVLALDREIQSRLIRLRGQVASQVRDISSRKGSAREYLSHEPTPEADQRGRLNVRL